MTTPNPVDIGKLVERLNQSALHGSAFAAEAASALTALVEERDELLLDAEEFDRIQSIRNAAQDALEASVVALEAERDRLRKRLGEIEASASRGNGPLARDHDGDALHAIGVAARQALGAEQ